MRLVSSCWIDDKDQGLGRCVAWCPVTNLLAIGARRRDQGTPKVILLEPSSPGEHFELCMESDGELQSSYDA